MSEGEEENATNPGGDSADTTKGQPFIHLIMVLLPTGADAIRASVQMAWAKIFDSADPDSIIWFMGEEAEDMRDALMSRCNEVGKNLLGNKARIFKDQTTLQQQLEEIVKGGIATRVRKHRIKLIEGDEFAVDFSLPHPTEIFNPIQVLGHSTTLSTFETTRKQVVEEKEKEGKDYEDPFRGVEIQLGHDKGVTFSQKEVDTILEGTSNGENDQATGSKPSAPVAPEAEEENPLSDDDALTAATNEPPAEPPLVATESEDAEAGTPEPAEEPKLEEPAAEVEEESPADPPEAVEADNAAEAAESETPPRQLSCTCGYQEPEGERTDGSECPGCDDGKLIAREQSAPDEDTSLITPHNTGADEDPIILNPCPGTNTTTGEVCGENRDSEGNCWNSDCSLFAANPPLANPGEEEEPVSEEPAQTAESPAEPDPVPAQPPVTHHPVHTPSTREKIGDGFVKIGDLIKGKKSP